MARIRGVEASEAGLFTRFLYWMTRRKVGRVIVPFKVTAHLPRLLVAVGGMEMGQQAVQTVAAKLKALAEIKAATLVGCPF
jgi:predicted glycosyltransferase